MAIADSPRELMQERSDQNGLLHAPPHPHTQWSSTVAASDSQSTDSSGSDSGSGRGVA